jgi:hypothetical protein
MKRFIGIALLTLALASSAVCQTTTKLGDAYGVAAMRVALSEQGVYYTLDQAVAREKTLHSLMFELEVQISSPAEQASFDVFLAIQEKKRVEGQKESNTTDTSVMFDRMLLRDKAFVPCYAALETNLKHRDGTMPKECK